jgi:hypothetical protein
VFDVFAKLGEDVKLSVSKWGKVVSGIPKSAEFGFKWS